MKAVTSRVYTASDGSTHTDKSKAAAHEVRVSLNAIKELGLPTADERSAEGFVEKSPADILADLLTGKTRVKFRETLYELIKLSNMMDHKPKAKKGEGVKKEPKASKEAKGDPKASAAPKK